MIYWTRSATILFLACVVTAGTASGRQPGIFLGTFDIGKRPLLPTRENLLAASAEVSRSGCAKEIRVLALVDQSFSPAALAPAGWRLISQVKDVVAIEGCERTAPYLTAIPGVLSVEHRTRIFPCLDSARRETHINEVHGTAQSSLTKYFTGKGVLVGFLDTEFDTHHPAFLDSLGHSRFIGLWDQTDVSKIRANRFGYGLIRMQQEIDKDTSFGLGGEEHGTIVASMGVGSDKNYPAYQGAAPEASIIGVKYGSDSGTTADIVNGLEWIFSIADSLKMPCVVNLSIGLQEGPHDGTSLVDRTIDALSDSGHIIVGAAGNDGATRVHIAFPLAAGETMGTWVWSQDVWDSVSPTNKKYLAYSCIDMWGEPNKPFSDTLYIRDSTGAYGKSGTALSTNRNSQSADKILWPDAVKGPDTLIIETFVERANATNQKPHMEIYVFSSNWDNIPGVRVTSGTACTIHAWNCYKRDMSAAGNPGFYDGDTTMTLNEVGGTAHSIISAGSYTSKASLTLYNQTPFGKPDSSLYMWASWSSIGPTVDGRIKPEICAPGRLVVGALSRSSPDNGRTVVWPNIASTAGRYEWSDGTSLSSPIVAGIVALMLQASPKLTPDSAVKVLQQTAIKDQFVSAVTPDVRWGAGKVDALAAISKLLGIAVESLQNGQLRAKGGAILVVRSGRTLVAMRDPAAADENAVVELFDMRGSLLAAIPLRSNSRTALIPEWVARGCFVARVKWCGGVSAAQVFPRL